MAKTEVLPSADSVMTRKVYTVHEEMSVDQVIRELLRHEISTAPVIRKEKGKKLLVGFISERDCLDNLTNVIFYGRRQADTAADIMKKHPLCVSPETDIFGLVSIFISHDMRHLPVVENEALVGIVSRRDVLKALTQYQKRKVVREDEASQHDLSQLVNMRFVMRGRR
ncbi:MAG TPA: CBS domain-containing protein [Pirellulaceae bacterium]|nr:CBS domain-containing protein [Pirellulaceae bacterium]HMO94121.1 CBS domain-containing protein [Pirellulaceae bacterium]HMP70837.1 CBS domain-containing protein [Pirellulaceae bacterium]